MPVRIAVNDVATFRAGYESLARYNEPRGSRVRAPNFAVAIASLLARNKNATGRWPVQISEIGEGPGLSTGELQTEVCDRAWRKDRSFLPTSAEGPIYKPFQLSFKPESTSGTNNWRNAFDLQVGLGCDAPHTSEFMFSADYLGEERFYCPYRNSESGNCTSPAGLTTRERTCFNPAKRGAPPGIGTNALRCPKLLARGIEDGQPRYWIAEPTADVLSQLIGDPEARVPVYPFMAALYCGSATLGNGRDRVTLEEFQSEIGLDNRQFGTVFDSSPESSFNDVFLRGTQRQTRTTAGVASQASQRTREGTGTARGRVQRRAFDFGRTPGEFRKLGLEAADPAQRIAALEKANSGHLFTTKAAATVFSEAGYRTDEDPSSFDLLCSKESTTYLIEVKTWSHANIKDQVRKAVSQLAEYEWRLQQAGVTDRVTKIIMLDQRPPAYMDFYLRAFVHDFMGILTCWVESATIASLTSTPLPL